MRVLLRPKVFSRPTQQPYRQFSTSRPLFEIDLAFDYHETFGPPKTGEVKHNAPILFIHGLFGSKLNNRSMSKALSRELRRACYTIDLRNHGDSPHAPKHNYTALAEDVEMFIRTHKLREPTIIGHSMGAKTAMTVALRSPDMVGNLISVDNAPVDAALKSDFTSYTIGMKKVEDAKVKTKKEADAILEQYAPELPIRQFIMTNLIFAPDKSCMQWRIPIKTLASSLDDMADFPFKDPDQVRFNKPALFVRGTKSHYVSDETLPIIGRFFPRFELRDIDSGHWVISENPKGFQAAVVEWLQNQE